VVARRQKVRFYRVEPRLIREDPWPNDDFPRHELSAAIRAREASTDRYVDVGSHIVMGLSGNTRPAYSEWSLYRVRRDELPDEETAGVITPLDLPAPSNLAEGAHLVTFRRNIVGIIGRREAPGRSAIGDYIEALLTDPRRSARLVPLIRPDVMALLTGVELVAATIRVAAGNATAVARASSTLGGAARSLSRQTSAASVEFTLRAGRTRPERREFRRDILQMLRPVRDSAANQVEKLEVEYISEEAGRQIVNLLGDDITVNLDVDMEVQRRSVPAEQAYEAIRQGYNEALAQLNQAIELG
jgi:hypothetical protein